MSHPKQAPRWFWLLLGSGVLAYVGYGVVPIVYCHYNGKETIAEVTDLTRETEPGINPEELPDEVHYITYAYDGHTVKKRGGKSRKIGDRVPVIYLPDNPQSVVRGSRADGLWNTIATSTNETMLGILVCLGVFFLLCGAKKPGGYSPPR